MVCTSFLPLHSPAILTGSLGIRSSTTYGFSYYFNILVSLFHSGLERFWKNAFMWLFIELFENNHLWTLNPIQKPPDDDGKGTPWETVIHSAKVRFNCEVSYNSWREIFIKNQVNFLRWGLVYLAGQSWMDFHARACRFLVPDPLWN